LRQVERLKAGGFEIEVYEENAPTCFCKFYPDINEGHRAAYAALEGVEGHDIHG
jgi:hypothetical protein